MCLPLPGSRLIIPRNLQQQNLSINNAIKLSCKPRNIELVCAFAAPDQPPTPLGGLALVLPGQVGQLALEVALAAAQVVQHGLVVAQLHLQRTDGGLREGGTVARNHT